MVLRLGVASRPPAGVVENRNLRNSDPILLLTGPPGAGKTTVARLLASRSQQGVQLEADAFFNFIARGYIEPWRPEAHEQNTAVMRIVADVAAAYAQAGYFTVVEGILIPAGSSNQYETPSSPAATGFAYAVVCATLATCLMRSRSRDNQPLADASAIGQLWSAFANLGDLERHVIATDTTEPAEIVHLITHDLNRLLTSPDSA